VKRYFLDRWLTVDTRTLGIFRVFLGLVLLGDLWDRVGGLNFVSFYTNDGVFPNHWALFRPPAPGFWSPLLGFSTPGEVRPLIFLIAVVYVLFLLGFKTRWMQVLALLCCESLNLRFLLVQHGGNVVMNLLLVWSVFLPLGARFSVDSVLASLRSQHESDAKALNARGWQAQVPGAHVGLAFFGICLNFAAIYFFNTIHKSGPAWLDGSAVHYVLWQNKVATPLAGFLRMHEPGWLSPLLTWGTLVVEGSLPLLILSPWWQGRLRTVALTNIWQFHGGIAALNTLGPFSYGMIAFGLLMIQPVVFEEFTKRLRWKSLERTVRADFSDPVQLLAARLLARVDLLNHLTFERGTRLEVLGSDGKTLGWAKLASALPTGRMWGWTFRLPLVPAIVGALFRLGARWYLETQRPPVPAHPEGAVHRQLRLAVQVALPALLGIAIASQLLIENHAVPESMKPRGRPELLTGIIDYLQIPQGWSMFAPDAPREDSRLVVDATLADGTHVDPLTGQAPDFDAPLHGPYGFDNAWCEIHARMPGWPDHWRNFKDYLFRLPKLQGLGPQKQLIAVEVWEVSATTPVPASVAFGEVQRRRLFDQNVR
jgi:hypothetical protein